MERAIWQSMVRSQTFPFSNFSVATDGQITWVHVNQLIDYDERVRKIHVHCLPKFHRDICEVCSQPIIDVTKLPQELQEEVYRPTEAEVKVVDIDLSKPPTFGDDSEA